VYVEAISEPHEMIWENWGWPMQKIVKGWALSVLVYFTILGLTIGLVYGYRMYLEELMPDLGGVCEKYKNVKYDTVNTMMKEGYYCYCAQLGVKDLWFE